MPDAEHADRQRDQQADDQQRRAGVLRQADRAEEARGDERADHEHLAVGEVDQLDDAVDERVADRHQRPDGAVGQAVDEVVAEAREVALVAREVADREVRPASRSRTTISPYFETKSRTA